MKSPPIKKWRWFHSIFNPPNHLEIRKEHTSYRVSSSSSSQLIFIRSNWKMTSLFLPGCPPVGRGVFILSVSLSFSRHSSRKYLVIYLLFRRFCFFFSASFRAVISQVFWRERRERAPQQGKNSQQRAVLIWTGRCYGNTDKSFDIIHENFTHSRQGDGGGIRSFFSRNSFASQMNSFTKISK